MSKQEIVIYVSMTIAPNCNPNVLFSCHHVRGNESNQTLTNNVCLFRLPDHDGRLVFRVCLRGGGRQEVPAPGCPGRDAAGTHCTSCLGPDGSPGITREIQFLAPTSGLFDSALVPRLLLPLQTSPALPDASFQNSLLFETKQ